MAASGITTPSTRSTGDRLSALIVVRPLILLPSLWWPRWAGFIHAWRQAMTLDAWLTCGTVGLVMVALASNRISPDLGMLGGLPC